MNLSNLSIFGLASDRMTWLAARQKVTSQNVANASTPDFKARDISPFESMLQSRTASAPGLATTHAKHLTSGTSGAPGIREIDDPLAEKMKLDGNTVVLEDQTIRAADTSDQYRMAAQLYRKSYDLLTLSVTGGR